jgi:FF domain
VTTKWARNFYHNPETNESYWKIPAAIRDIVEAWQLNTARVDAASSESEEDEYSDYDSQPDVDPEDMPVEFTEDDIAYQLEQMQTEYGDMLEFQEEEEELDDLAKRQIFISLLEDKEINPFNPWESEMPKMVGDPRYSMIRNTKQRMEYFAEWARARIALIKEEKEREVKEDVFPSAYDMNR